MEAVETVRVDVPVGVTMDGLKVLAAPVGKPVTLMDTGWLNPAREVKVTA